MTKIQKIWLGILIGVPVIIEVLFQSTIRLVSGVITIKNITFGHKYGLALSQSVLLLLAAILVLVWRKSFRRRWVCYLLFGFLLLWALVAYLGFDLALNGRVEVGGF